MPFSRRDFAKNTLAATAAVGLPGILMAAATTEAKKLKVVCVGGHPDDPEACCGGTLAKLSAGGHEVTVIYLTRGEAGIANTSHDDAAAIRTKEAIAACAILNVKPIFAGQIDGDTIVNTEWIDKILHLIKAEKPDIVFTHWPIDAHKDHQAAGLLTIQSWMRIEKKFELYFFEACTGSQTHCFKPTDYVDITPTREQKRKAVFCHASQNPAGIYAAPDCNHTIIENFRGIEMNVGAAEAFVRMGQGLKW